MIKQCQLPYILSAKNKTVYCVVEKTTASESQEEKIVSLNFFLKLLFKTFFFQTKLILRYGLHAHRFTRVQNPGGGVIWNVFFQKIWVHWCYVIFKWGSSFCALLNFYLNFFEDFPGGSYISPHPLSTSTCTPLLVPHGPSHSPTPRMHRLEQKNRTERGGGV